MEHVHIASSKETNKDAQEATTSQTDDGRKPMNSQSSVELNNCTLDPNNIPTCNNVTIQNCNGMPIPTCSNAPVPTCSTGPQPPSNSVFLKNITTLDLKAIGVPLILLRNALPSAALEVSQQSLDCEVSSSTNPPETSALRSPPTLFHQSLAELKKTTISSALLKNLSNNVFSPRGAHKTGSNIGPPPELSTPNSATSAPPSYSFVLRQINAQRRPRLMGTFIPSPSFVQQAPPPNYAAAFDIYIDTPPPIPLVQQRTCQFSYMPINIICPECGFGGATVIKCKVTIWTHLCAIVLCLMCCWVCAPFPYLLNSCKNVFHYCRNCRTLLGMYSPSNPDNQHMR